MIEFYMTLYNILKGKKHTLFSTNNDNQSTQPFHHIKDQQQSSMQQSNQEQSHEQESNVQQSSIQQNNKEKSNEQGSNNPSNEQQGKLLCDKKTFCFVGCSLCLGILIINITGKNYEKDCQPGKGHHQIPLLKKNPNKIKIDYENKDLTKGDIYKLYCGKLQFVDSYSSNNQSQDRRAQHFNSLVTTLKQEDLFKDQDLTKDMIDKSIDHAITSGKYSLFQKVDNVCTYACAINTDISLVLSYMHNFPIVCDNLLTSMKQKDFSIYKKNMINLFFREFLYANHEFQFQWFLLAYYGDKVNNQSEHIIDTLNRLNTSDNPLYQMMRKYITCAPYFQINSGGDDPLNIMQYYFGLKIKNPYDNNYVYLCDNKDGYSSMLSLKKINIIDNYIESKIDNKDKKLTKYILEHPGRYNLNKVKEMNNFCQGILSEYIEKLSNYIHKEKDLNQCNNCVNTKKQCNCKLKKQLEEYYPIYQIIFNDNVEYYSKKKGYIKDYKKISNVIDLLYYAHESIIASFVQYKKDFDGFKQQFNQFKEDFAYKTGYTIEDFHGIKDENTKKTIHQKLQNTNLCDVFSLKEGENLISNKLKEFIEEYKIFTESNEFSSDNYDDFHSCLHTLKDNFKREILDSFAVIHHDNSPLLKTLKQRSIDYKKQEYVDEDFIVNLCTNKDIYSIMRKVIKCLLTKVKENQHSKKTHDFQSIAKYFLIAMIKKLEIFVINEEIEQSYDENTLFGFKQLQDFHYSSMFLYKGNIYRQSSGKFTKQEYKSIKDVPIWENFYYRYKNNNLPDLEMVLEYFIHKPS